MALNFCFIVTSHYRWTQILDMTATVALSCVSIEHW